VGEEEISWTKANPPIPQMMNNKIRRTHEPNVFTPFPCMDDVKRHFY
jgi:hypothetical protein